MALFRSRLLAGAIFAGALFGTSQVTAPPEPISTSGGGGGYAASWHIGWHIGKFDRLQKQEKQRRNQAKDEQELTLILSVLASERLLI